MIHLAAIGLKLPAYAELDLGESLLLENQSLQTGLAPPRLARLRALR